MIIMFHTCGNYFDRSNENAGITFDLIKAGFHNRHDPRSLQKNVERSLSLQVFIRSPLSLQNKNTREDLGQRKTLYIQPPESSFNMTATIVG